MKKILFLLAVLPMFLFTACSKDDDYSKTVQDIWVVGCKALTPTSDYEKVSTKFLLFESDGNDDFDIKGQQFTGTISDYQQIQDENWELLLDSKIKKKDGSIAEATYSIIYLPAYDRNEPTKVRNGKYFMVAIYIDSKAGYLWLYSNKYACQYVDIQYKDTPFYFYSVVFPCDLHNYGKVEWVSTGQKPYPYNFDFD